MTTITYQVLEGLPTGAVLASLIEINQTIFGFGETAEHLTQAFQHQPSVLLCLASIEDEIVGFKIGHAENPRTFNSWRGGVLESARRQGIAEELLRQQHAWCQQNGFRTITTVTHSPNIPMLILNLRNGFFVMGTMLHRGKHLKLFLEKKLVPDP